MELLKEIFIYLVAGPLKFEQIQEKNSMSANWNKFETKSTHRLDFRLNMFE